MYKVSSDSIESGIFCRGETTLADEPSNGLETEAGFDDSLSVVIPVSSLIAGVLVSSIPIESGILCLGKTTVVDELSITLDIDVVLIIPYLA